MVVVAKTLAKGEEVCVINLSFYIFVIQFLLWFICDFIYNITLCSEWL